jgi:hypothetical protein
LPDDNRRLEPRLPHQVTDYKSVLVVRAAEADVRRSVCGELHPSYSIPIAPASANAGRDLLRPGNPPTEAQWAKPWPARARRGGHEAGISGSEASGDAGCQPDGAWAKPWFSASRNAARSDTHE